MEPAYATKKRLTIAAGCGHTYVHTMEFPSPLVRGRLIRRYKRFLSDILLEDGRTTTAHCPNPGSMLGLQAPDSEVWLARATNPKRKLPYTWELVRVGDGLVGIHAARANQIAAEAIAQGRIGELQGYGTIRREVPYGASSRVDMLLTEPGRADCYAEVKNVHLRRDAGRSGTAEFPDSVTKRGAKHLVELANMVRSGARAIMIYVVQRQDCDCFRLAEDIDPTYAAAFAEAKSAGVETICYACTLTTTGIEISRQLLISERTS